MLPEHLEAMRGLKRKEEVVDVLELLPDAEVSPTTIEARLRLHTAYCRPSAPEVLVVWTFHMMRCVCRWCGGHLPRMLTRLRSTST